MSTSTHWHYLSFHSFPPAECLARVRYGILSVCLYVALYCYLTQVCTLIMPTPERYPLLGLSDLSGNYSLWH